MDIIKAKECYQELLSQKLIMEFKARNLEGFYCKTKEEALNKVLEMIPEDSSVSCGGSVTLDEIGLRLALKNGKYNFVDPKDAQKLGANAMEKAAHKGLSADYFLMSTNAISVTGELVNADGIGNRVAPLIFGPKNVIVIAGLNKVEPNLDSAIQRVKNYAAQMISLSYNQDYSNFDELSNAAKNSCSQLVITSNSVFKGRIKVILVGECLGY